MLSSPDDDLFKRPNDLTGLTLQNNEPRGLEKKFAILDFVLKSLIQAGERVADLSAENVLVKVSSRSPEVKGHGCDGQDWPLRSLVVEGLGLVANVARK